MSGHRWFRVSLMATVVLSPGLWVLAWQEKVPPAKSVDAKGVAANGANGRAGTALPRTADESNEAAIRRALLQRMTVNFVEVQLEDAIAWLARKHQLPIDIDRETLNEDRIPFDRPITIRVVDVTLQSLLSLILEPLQLTVVIRDETLLVTTFSKAETALETRFYDVRGLIEDGESGPLIDVVKSCVAPLGWNESGGRGSVRALPNGLAIRQTPQVHFEIGDLLQELQRLLAHPAGAPVPELLPDPIRDVEVALHKRLAQPASLDCHEHALVTVLESLSHSYGVPLQIDHPALAAIQVEPTRPVSLVANEIRLGSLLNRLLGPLQLRWVIEHEVVLVTTRSPANSNLVTTVYDLRDFAHELHDLKWPPPAIGGSGSGGGIMGGGGLGMMQVDDGGFEINLQAGPGIPVGICGLAAGGLIGPPAPPYDPAARRTVIEDLLSTVVAPELWNGVGGPGTMRSFRGTLVVRQTRGVHAEIESTLAKLRRLPLETEKPAVDTKREPADSVQLVVYQLGRFPPENLEKLIPQVVMPESWKSAGGQGLIHAIPKGIVVRQTRRIHKEIVKVLYDVVAPTLRMLDAGENLGIRPGFVEDDIGVPP
ncbi:MAG: hypothetical protein ACKV0T_10235 [Planctomycetales bacterium]